MSKKPENFGKDDCQCRHCRAMKTNGLFAKGSTLNHGPYKKKLGPGEVNRQTLPGDIDYQGVVKGAK